MLRIEKVHASYGAIKALKGISIEVGEGELVALIGANGAGKTTTLKSILGLVEIDDGHIHYKSQKISGLKPHEIVKKRIAMVPEGRKIFADMTVEENLDPDYSR